MNAKSKPNKRKLQSDATRRSILVAARKTFKSRGFRATTIREVANAAGVGTGTVLAHFGSKEALLYEVLYGDIERIAKHALGGLAPNQPLAESLERVAGSFLVGYAAEPDLYADFLEHSLFARGTWGEKFKRQVEDVGLQVGQLFAASIERDEIAAGTDIRAATMTFFANYYFVLIGQIKSRFSDVEDGMVLLRMLIHHQISGLQN